MFFGERGTTVPRELHAGLSSPARPNWGAAPMNALKETRASKLVVSALVLAVAGVARGVADTPPRGPGSAPDGWTAPAPRDEIRPEFAFRPNAGTTGQGCPRVRAPR